MPEPFKILLVEDNSDDEQLTLRALRKLGDRVEVAVAHDGQEALDSMISGTGELPNLVLLDLKLPKVNGLDVLKKLRENEKTAHVLVVVLSSSDEPDDVRASYRQYANSYIHKPVSYEDFSDVVARLGIYWLKTNVDGR